MPSISTKGLTSDFLNANEEIEDEDPVSFHPKVSENHYSLPITQQSFILFIVLLCKIETENIFLYYLENYQTVIVIGNSGFINNKFNFF
jgi:hypothetical protein